MSTNGFTTLSALADKVAEMKTAWILAYGSEEKMLHKIAGSSEEFEQAFFQLAYDKLQNKLKNLLPFLVGFEVVNKSDDNTKAVGVFGFKSDNGQILLVPAFFGNGKIKDLDILYSRNNNQFYPLNEDFAESFLKDDVTGLGSSADQTRNEIMRLSPPSDFRDMAIPPRTGRTVMASVIEYIQESDGFVKEAMAKWFESQPDMLAAMAQFYSLEKISEALEHVPPAPLVEIHRSSDLAEKRAEFSDEEKISLLANGYLIRDKRAAEQYSKFGKLELSSLYSSPEKSGKYQYVTASGQVVDGYVLKGPAGFGVLRNPLPYLVYDLETKFVWPVDTVHVKSCDKPVCSAEGIEGKLTSLGGVTPGYRSRYVLLDTETGDCSRPFEVLSNGKDDSGVRRISVRMLYQSIPSEPTSFKLNNSYFAPAYGRGNCVSPCLASDFAGDSVVLVPIKKTGGPLHVAGNTVYVPKTYRLLEVLTSPYDFDPPYESDRDSKKRQAFELEMAKASRLRAELFTRRPGTMLDLARGLAGNGVYPMSLRRQSGNYFAKIGASDIQCSGRNEAILALVGLAGFSEKTAVALLDSLIDDVTVTGQVKLAYTGDYTPPVVDEAPWYNELGQPTYSGIPNVQFGPLDPTYTGDPTRLGLGVKEEVDSGGNAAGDVQRAVALAQSGQKEIFDTHAIATIAKYVDPTTKVVSYIPSFVDTLDKLGRMLFMFNWETDKFQKMYGADELPELLELLKSIFKNLGDLVIFLKRKYPDISINSNEQAGEK